MGVEKVYSKGEYVKKLKVTKAHPAIALNLQIQNPVLREVIRGVIWDWVF
ncbi:hypothetical protein [Nostoc sp.]